MNTPIHPDTRLGHVAITVSDLPSARLFYQDALGFKTHRLEKNTAYLGAGGADLLKLTENPDAHLVPFSTGLYHFAILVPSRVELAHSLKRMIDTQIPLQGFSDHLVSEALYLADPDGNGIEIYRDRPRSEWYDARGRFKMGTEPLDVRGLLRELDKAEGTWTGLDPRTVLGHMHLRISNVKRDEAFYRQVLGFDEMAVMPTAAFVSAGGYHHHIGMNTWQSADAPPPPPDAVGLQYFTVNLPNTDELYRLADRVRETGQMPEETDEGLLIRDPSQNGVVLTTQ